MADVLLREYVDDLRGLLYAGKHADALALGRHILFYFPKHIETYTLLAQACLEMNDLAGATDLLRRVLSADPENVLALAGMALMSESQEKLEDALWYLERAYEVQPSNDDLRREVLRVRELYYGTAVTRLELTPGALARVYARQGQYAQAVNEFRRLLRNDSKRFDARVGLAEALFRAGRTDEAAQVAQSVMADAPFALKPNLILGYLWSQNAVPEGQQFLHRAQQLDPEHRVAHSLIGEQFANGQSPRLPVLGERAPAPQAEEQVIGDVSLAPAGTEAPGTRAAEFLRDLERAQEPEPSVEEPLLADLDVLSLVESIPAESIPSGAPALPAETEAVASPGDTAASGMQVPGPEIPGEPVSDTAAMSVESAADAMAVSTESVAETVGVSAESAADTMAVSVESAADMVGVSAEPPAPEEGMGTAETTREADTDRVTVPAAVIPIASELEPAQALAPESAEAEALTSVIAEPKEESAEVAPATTNGAAEDRTPPPARKRKEAVSPEAIAAAAAALATSIALDKSSQPAPTRRSHSAIPKVRPVIRGAAEKLPVWLRLGTTPAAASASFDLEPPGSTDTITPLKTSTQNQPDWLVEAQEAAAKESALQQERQELPDWLTVDVMPESKPLVEAAREELPSWLENAGQLTEEQPVETAPPASTATSAELPEWLQDQTDQVPPAAPAVEDKPPQVPVAPTEELTAPALEEASPESPRTAMEEAEVAAPASEPALDEGPIPAREELRQEPVTPADAPAAQETLLEEPEPAPAPAPMLPDSATMLQMARDKRDSGDLKGALELYERVMHRRPNYLDQVIGDMQEIIARGGAPTTANRLLGEAFAMAGRFKESLEQYRIAMGK